MSSSSASDETCAKPAPHLAADRVAGEVPRGVLAERRASRSTHRRRRRGGRRAARAWSTITAAANAERTRRRRRAAGEHLEQVAEQPRPAEAAAADHDAVAPGVAHHRRRRRRPPRCRRCRARGSTSTCCLELADRVPAGVAGVVLLDGAGVQGDRHDALVGADRTGPQVGAAGRRGGRCGTSPSPGRRTARGRRARPTHDGPQQARLGRARRRHRPCGSPSAAGQPKLRSTWSTRPRAAHAVDGPAHHARGRSRRSAGCAGARRGRTSSSAPSWRCRARRPSPSPSR